MVDLHEVRRFVHEHIVPLEPLMLQHGFSGELLQQVHALRELVKERGWWAPQVRKEWGGAGLDLVEHGRLSEILGYSPLGHYVFGAQAPDAGNIEVLGEFGTDEQRARWLAPLVAGEIRSCFGMSEPENAGSDPTELSTTARRVAGGWAIDGHKWFTTGADGAAFCIVMAVTHPEAPPHMRASMFIVPMDTPGLEFVRNIPVMGEAGSGWASHAELRFRHCVVPESALLGGEAMGFAIAQQRLGPGRIHHCMRWIGISERAMDMMCARAVSRVSGGKPLSHRQTVQSWVAEGRARLEAARLLVLETALRIERDGSRAARTHISMIKFLVADVMLDILDRAVQTHGALGMTDDTVLAFLYRHERASRIYDGPDEVHKSVVARQEFSRWEKKK